MRASYLLQKGHPELIIFTVTNKVTGQVYVGTTRNDLESQWEKMIAAAEQNMDYPLYRDLRTQGTDNFLVEEWDCTDDRSELAALEREAIETFSAKSLRGYKTSTVKIQPKKKVRQRKSSIEKELASIFASFSDGDDNDEIPTPSTPTSSSVQKAPADATATVSAKPAQQKTVTASKPVANAIFDIDDKKSSKENEANKAQPTEQPAGGSQANSVVQMNAINLSDDITAQLAAIQAAADAAIAGDTSTAAELSFVKKEEQPEPSNPVAAETVANVNKPEITPEPVIEIDPKIQRIRDAVERNRERRAQTTADMQAAEKQKIARLLSELEERVASMQSVSLANAA